MSSASAGKPSDKSTTATAKAEVGEGVEASVEFVEEDGFWVQVEKAADGTEKRTQLGAVVKDEDHPNKPEGWTPPEE